MRQVVSGRLREVGAEGVEVHVERDGAGDPMHSASGGFPLVRVHDFLSELASLGQWGAEVAGDQKGQGDGEECRIRDGALAPLHGRRDDVGPVAAEEEPELCGRYADDVGSGIDGDERHI